MPSALRAMGSLDSPGDIISVELFTMEGVTLYGGACAFIRPELLFMGWL